MWFHGVWVAERGGNPCAIHSHDAGVACIHICQMSLQLAIVD